MMKHHQGGKRATASAKAQKMTICRGVRVLVGEMHAMADRPSGSGERAARRSHCHLRQIAMYVCHVVLQLSLTDIGTVYGRDRTTVGHACKVIEDRRDDRAYDDFVSSIERVVKAVFASEKSNGHD